MTSRFCKYVDRTKERICGRLMPADAKPVLIVSPDTGQLVETDICLDHQRILLELTTPDRQPEDVASNTKLAQFIEVALHPETVIDVNKLSNEAIRNALRILAESGKLPRGVTVGKRGPITEPMVEAVAQNLGELGMDWLLSGLQDRE